MPGVRAERKVETMRKVKRIFATTMFIVSMIVATLICSPFWLLKIIVDLVTWLIHAIDALMAKISWIFIKFGWGDDEEEMAEWDECLKAAIERRHEQYESIAELTDGYLTIVYDGFLLK